MIIARATCATRALSARDDDTRCVMPRDADTSARYRHR